MSRPANQMSQLEITWNNVRYHPLRYHSFSIAFAFCCLMSVGCAILTVFCLWNAPSWGATGWLCAATFAINTVLWAAFASVEP